MLAGGPLNPRPQTVSPEAFLLFYVVTVLILWMVAVIVYVAGFGL